MKRTSGIRSELCTGKATVLVMPECLEPVLSGVEGSGIHVSVDLW